MNTLLLHRGFRFFFLAAGLHAVLGMAAWLGWLGKLSYGLGWDVPTAMAVPSLWHAHEMLFGFAGAAIGGFLTTAVPNWVGASPPKVKPVTILAVLWLVGRLAVWTSGFWPPAIPAAADLLYLPAVAVVVTPMILRAKQWRNIGFPVFIGLLWLGQILSHAETLGLAEDTAVIGVRLAIAAILGMIAVVGGRIVPNFTANWLRARGGPDIVRRSPRFEMALHAVTALALAAWLSPFTAVASGLLAAAAIMHAIRMSGWRTRQVLGEPIVWVLHLGYFWLVVGLALAALALGTGALPETAALHAFTAGTIGTMVLGVMTRAALGHSGRPLAIRRPIVAAYGLVSASALLRLGSTVVGGDWYGPMLFAAGGAWIAAFAIYSAVYAPMLVKPRADGQPG